jgi:MFS transporter, DHA2 family, multidrug resistance protein
MRGSAGDVAAPGAPSRATGREWAGLAVLALPTLLVSMDLTVLHLAVPQISADLRPSSAQMLWIVDIYGFLVAGSLITMGTLGDRIGRRRLLLAGATAFSAASVLAAFAVSAEMLIAARALLGLAGATLLPSTVALIRNMFVDPRQRAVAIGIWAAVFSAGTAIGPVLGGALLDWFWWGSVFLLGLPLMAGLLALGPAFLPEFRDPDAGRLDIPSAGLSLAGVLSVVYGLKRIAEGGLATSPALFIVAGLVAGVAFVRRQRKLPDPLIDLRLFSVPAFSVSLAAGLLTLFTWAGTYLFLAQYLQLVKDLSPLEAGMWLLPAAGGSIAGSMLSPALSSWVRPATVLAGGLWVAAIGFAVVTQVETTSSLFILVTGSIVFSIGIASTVALVTDQVVGAAPAERAGAAAALSETGGELGLALGVAILGSIGTAVYRGDLDDALVGLPPGAQEAARDTLGGAVAVAGQLPESAATGLLDAAREAFTHGLQLTAGISVFVAAGTAILVTVVLRRSAVDARTDAQPEASLEEMGTPYAPDGLATVGSAARPPCRCCGPELMAPVAGVTGTEEPTRPE